MMSQQAQLLQCPDCGHRHDLTTLGDVQTFRCSQCGRALKVPAQFRGADETVRQPAVSRRAEPAPVARPVDGVGAPEREAATAAPRPLRMSRHDPRKPHVPVYWRLLIWVAAIPLGLVVVFQLIARKLGWLTQNQLVDAFTSGGWDRFRPIAQLLPLAAFAIASIVQLSVFGLECWYRRRARLQTAGAAGAAATPQPAARATGS